MRFHQNTYGGQLAPLKLWNVVFLISDTWFFIRMQQGHWNTEMSHCCVQTPKKSGKDRAWYSCYRWTAAQWAATCRNAGYIRGTAAQRAANCRNAGYIIGELRLNEPQIRIFTLAQAFFLSSPLCVARRLRMALGLTSSAGWRKGRGKEGVTGPEHLRLIEPQHANMSMHIYFLHTDSKSQQELQSTRGSLSRLRSKDRKCSHLHFVNACSKLFRKVLTTIATFWVVGYQQTASCYDHGVWPDESPRDLPAELQRSSQFHWDLGAAGGDVSERNQKPGQVRLARRGTFVGFGSTKYSMDEGFEGDHSKKYPAQSARIHAKAGYRDHPLPASKFYLLSNLPDARRLGLRFESFKTCGGENSHSVGTALSSGFEGTQWRYPGHADCLHAADGPAQAVWQPAITVSLPCCQAVGEAVSQDSQRFRFRWFLSRFACLFEGNRRWTKRKWVQRWGATCWLTFRDHHGIFFCFSGCLWFLSGPTAAASQSACPKASPLAGSNRNMGLLAIHMWRSQWTATLLGSL